MELKAMDAMRTKPVTCSGHDSLTKAIKDLLTGDMDSCLVRRKGKITGILTKSDIIRAALAKRDTQATKAQECMSAPLDCCKADDSLEKCMEIFEKNHRFRLVVMEGEEVVGILRKDIAKGFLKVSRDFTLKRISPSPKYRLGRLERDLYKR